MQNKQASIANVSGMSTAAGFSFLHLNGNKSPKEFSQGSCQTTRRNSKENFCKKLFIERPKAQKLSYKLKQSSDFDDNDRHFSLDESRLQGSKSWKVDGFEYVTDSKKLRNQSFQGVDTLQNPAPVKKSIKVGATNNNGLALAEQTSIGSTPFKSPAQNQNQQNVEDMYSQLYMENHTHQKKLQVAQKLKDEEFDLKGYHMTETIKKYRNPKDEEAGGTRTIEAAGIGTNHHNMMDSGRDSEGIQQSKMLYNSIGDGKEPLHTALLMRSVFAILVLTVVIGLASYNYGYVLVFTFINTVIFGTSYSLLLIYLITSHPFFKLTNEQAVDIFTTPKIIYLGVILCLSSFYGFIFGSEKLEFQLNLFISLPLFVIIAFAIFVICICYKQPLLYKRLKLTYGNGDGLEKKLTLSESRAFRKGKGMTQQKLPANLQNFMPDEQGPKIKSSQFYFAMMLVILLQIAQVYYMFNQQFIWENKVKSSFYYIYLMILVQLVIGEVTAGIVYKIDSKCELEFKYELEVIRCTFTVSLYHLFYIMVPSIKQGISIIIIKIAFKIVMYYIYPTNYETIKTFLRRSIMRCFNKDKQAEFKEMQRRLFTKKLGILQFTDLISLVLFYAIVIIFKTNMHLVSDFTSLEGSEFKNITILCMIEFVAEIILTFLLINFLSKNERFKGLDINKILKEITQFLQDCSMLTIFTYFSVFSTIVICISNNFLKFTDFKNTYLSQL